MAGKRLAIVTTHPIQYYAPLFRDLARSTLVEPRVYYTWAESEHGPVYDPGFATQFAWDVPLLAGYSFEFVPNEARKPGPGAFRGIVNSTLNERIEAWGAEALLVFGWNLQSHLGAMRHFSGRIPVFFRGDSTLLDPRSRLRALARRQVLRWVYRHIDCALAVGECNREYFDWCGVPSERIAILPHSVDVSRFADESGDSASHAVGLRGQLGIGEDEFVFLYAGKFIPQKGLADFITAFRHATIDAHLVLVGQGPLEAKLRALAHGAPRIHFLPFQNQARMPAVYRIGDVVVLPSHSETWGLALNEAMACGRAVIASALVGGAIDLITPGTHGWTFECGNESDLVGVLRECCATGRSRILGMGGACAERIRNSSSQAIAQRLAQVIASFADGPRAKGARWEMSSARRARVTAQGPIETSLPRE